MSKTKELAKQLPPTELPFSVEITGSITKRKYVGDFVTKIPTTGDWSRIGVELTKLNKGLKIRDLEEEVQLINNAIAYLKVTLIDAPKWFTDKECDYGQNLLDPNVVLSIHSQAQDEADKWYAAVRGDEVEEEKNTP